MTNQCSCSSSLESKIEEKDLHIIPSHELVDLGTMEKEIKILPMGFHFWPTDSEIFKFYLMNKIFNQNIPCNIIQEEINVFKLDPQELPQSEFKHGKRKIAYIFTFDEEHDLDGVGTRKETSSGYWEISSEEIVDLGPEIKGFKNDLVFYERKESQGKETNWRMVQYRIKLGPTQVNALGANKDREKYSVCKIWSHSEKEEEWWELETSLETAEEDSSDSETEED